MTVTSDRELKNRRRTRIPQYAMSDNAKNTIAKAARKCQDGSIKYTCQYCFEFDGIYLYEWKVRCIRCYRLVFPEFKPTNTRKYGWTDNPLFYTKEVKS